MKQVYTQQKETQTSSVRAHVKAWVLFIGFLVWLVAVKETFGQSANSNANKANTRLTEISPLAGACNIQVSAALQYQDGQGRYKSLVLMQSQQITFRLRDANKVVVATAVGTTDGNGVATAQLNVPATAVQLEAEYAGSDLYKKTSQAVAFKVEDKIAPVVSLKSGVTLALDGNGNATLSRAEVRVSSTDNCGILAEVLNKTAFDCSHVGANTVTLTVTDNNGNVTEKTATVTVQDKTAPVVLIQPATLQLDANGAASLTLNHVRVSSSDACGIKSEVLSQTAFGCDNLGENKVLLTVTDHNGNVSTAEVSVTVEDKTVPAIQGMPANRTLLAGANCQAVAAWIEPSFSDNCGIKTFSASHPSGSAFGLGVNTVTYSVEDNSGNVSQASFTVTGHENLTTDAPVTVLDLQGRLVYRRVLAAHGVRSLEVNLAGKQAGL
ncbi:MAG: HYR domain-containing protein, partial [Cytophagales bacterium]|nr:HYR domain-containing protein [Cytophagales bacterium]